MEQICEAGSDDPDMSDNIEQGGEAVVGGPAEGLAQRIKHAGQALCDAIASVADQVPARSRSPQEFARTLDVHRNLASRLLNAVRTDDPLAAVQRMPRSEGLRMFLNAARLRVPRAAVERAEIALREFEQVIQGDLGGWDGFDAAVTEWLPEARARFELANKQLAFKGMANIVGARSDVQLDTIIYYPDATGTRCDIGMIEGMVGLRRLRPSVRLPIAVHAPSPLAPRPLPYELQGIQPGEAADEYPLLDDFCSSPPPKLEAIHVGDVTYYVLAGNAIGPNAAVDVFASSVIRGGRPIYSEPGEPPYRPHSAVGLTLPSTTLLMNMLVHEDIWPHAEPGLLVYDMGRQGAGDHGGMVSDLDCLDMLESVQALGTGVSRFRASDVGRYVEMVSYVCGSLGWDANRLRGYRVRVQYPLVGVHYCLAFDPVPERES
jgi:hypothetical protein